MNIRYLSNNAADLEVSLGLHSDRLRKQQAAVAVALRSIDAVLDHLRNDIKKIMSEVEGDFDLSIDEAEGMIGVPAEADIETTREAAE